MVVISNVNLDEQDTEILSQAYNLIDEILSIMSQNADATIGGRHIGIATLEAARSCLTLLTPETEPVYMPTNQLADKDEIDARWYSNPIAKDEYRFDCMGLLCDKCPYSSTKNGDCLLAIDEVHGLTKDEMEAFRAKYETPKQISNKWDNLWVKTPEGYSFECETLGCNDCPYHHFVEDCFDNTEHLTYDEMIALRQQYEQDSAE